MAIPDTNTFNQRTVCTELGYGGLNIALDYLFDHSLLGNFDPDYKEDMDELNDFRNYATPVLSVSPTSVNHGYAGQSTNVTVTTNREWSIVVNPPSWFTISNLTQSGFTLTSSYNGGYNLPLTEMVLKHDDSPATKTFVLTKLGKLGSGGFAPTPVSVSPSYMAFAWGDAGSSDKKTGTFSPTSGVTIVATGDSSWFSYGITGAGTFQVYTIHHNGYPGYLRTMYLTFSKSGYLDTTLKVIHATQ